MKKLFSNALNRFLEIKKLNAQNYWFLFIYFFLFLCYFASEFDGRSRLSLSGIIISSNIAHFLNAVLTVVLVRLTPMLYYFIGGFSNKRFKIITIIFIVMILTAWLQAPEIAIPAGIIMYLFSRGYGKKEDV